MFVRSVKDDLDSDRIGFIHYHDHLFVFQTKETQLPERLLLNSYISARSDILDFNT